MTRARAAIGLLVAVQWMTSAEAARADWHDPADVIHGTAHTLEQGQWMIGVFTPVVYGINDSLMVITHPVLWVLLTPNGGLRWRIVESERVTFAVQADGARSFLATETGELRDPRPTGRIATSTLTTFDLGARVLLTVQVGYQHDFLPAEDHLTFSGGVGWVIQPNHLLSLQGGSSWAFNARAVGQTTAMLLYTRAWDTLHLSVGVAYGNFPIALTSSAPLLVPVWPVVDVWWRF